MMTCREVSLLVSTGEVADAPWTQRLGVRLHLAMCRHCRAFRRQLRAIARAVRMVSDDFEREASSDLASRLVQRLGKTR